MNTLKQVKQRTLDAFALASVIALSIPPAFAQTSGGAPTVQTGGLGEQFNKMSSEGMNTAGTAFGFAC